MIQCVVMNHVVRVILCSTQDLLNIGIKILNQVQDDIVQVRDDTVRCHESCCACHPVLDTGSIQY